MSRRLAVIPARSGSSRIADKNIRPFCGRPLLLRAIDTARDSCLFDEIHVSTDSALYAELAAQAGARPPFLRPAPLADNRASLTDVLRTTVARYAASGETFDEICLIYATAPLLEPSDLIEAQAAFESAGFRAITLAVAKFPSAPERALRGRDDGLVRWNAPDSRLTHSQDCGPAYYDAGAFCWFTRAQVMASGSAPPLAFLPHLLPASRVVDINDEDDFALAEALYRGRMAMAGHRQAAI